jgi:hypothetical protein
MEHTVGAGSLSRASVHVDRHIDASSINGGDDGHLDLEGRSLGFVWDDVGHGTGAGDVVQDDGSRRSVCEDQARAKDGGQEEEIGRFHLGDG